MVKKSSLERLPEELRLKVCRRADVRDITQLRLACKTVAAACLTILQARCSRLYLHPTRLQHALEVCGSETFASGITEIVVLGYSTPEQYGGDHRHFHNGTDLAQRLCDHTWPLVATAELEIRMPTVSVPGLQQTLLENHQELFDAISTLTNVKALTYASSADYEGLCGVITDTVKTHAEGCKNYAAFFDGRNQPALQDKHLLYRWSDAEMMLALMQHLGSQSRLTTLRLEQPLPLCDWIKWNMLHPGITSAGGLSPNALRDVTSFTTTIPGNAHWQLTLRGLISGMFSLQELAINAHSIIDAVWQDAERSEREHTRDGYQPEEIRYWDEERGRVNYFSTVPSQVQLRCLRIRGKSELPEMLFSAHIVPLLQQSIYTLQEVEISNLFFIDHETPWSEPHEWVTAGMERVLNALIELPQLARVDFKVPRYGCDRDCKIATGPNHSILCHRYRIFEPAGLGWRRVEIFEPLTTAWGVEAVDGIWDFGAEVMRRRETIAQAAVEM